MTGERRTVLTKAGSVSFD